MSNPFQFFHLFILSVFDHMFTLAAGCVLTVVIGIIEKYVVKRPVSWKVDIVVLLVFLFFACFQAWRDQYVIAKKLKPDQQPVITQTINVPPAQVIIQQPAVSSAPADPTGYVQIEKIVPAPDRGTVAENKGLAFRIYEWNPGPHPVQNVHQVSGLGIVDMSTANAERSFRKLFDAERKKLTDKIAKEKKQGVSMDVGGGGQFKDFTLAHIEDPLTKEQVEGVLSGNSRIYVTFWITWEDSHKRKGTLDACYRLADVPKTAALENENLIWKACDQQ